MTPPSGPAALLPCPFCGASGNLTLSSSGDGVVFVLCSCGGEGPAEENEVEAIAAWNRRAPSPDAARAEELARWLEYSLAGDAHEDDRANAKEIAALLRRWPVYNGPVRCACGQFHESVVAPLDREALAVALAQVYGIANEPSEVAQREMYLRDADAVLRVLRGGPETRENG